MVKLVNSPIQAGNWVDFVETPCMKGGFLMFSQTKKEIKLLFVILLIPFLVLGYFIFYENIQLKLEDEKIRNIELAKITAQYIDTYVKNIKYGLNTVQDERLDIRDQQQIQKFFQKYISADEIESYFVLDSKGTLINNYPQGQSNSRMFLPGMLPQVSEEPLMELVDAHDDPIRVRLTTLIQDTRGYVQGYVGVIFSMKKIASDFSNIKVSNNGYMIMIDTAGHVLVHPNTTKLRQVVPQEQMAQDPIFQAATQTMTGAIDIVAPYDGERKLFAYAHLQEVNWIVLLVEPDSDLEVITTRLITRNAAIFLLVGATVLVLLRYLHLLRIRDIEQATIRSEKLALVGQLAAGMAHEIRNPLTAVKGFLQMMLDSETAENKQRWLNIMLTETKQIEGIVNETLLLAKPQKETVTKFELDQQIRQIIPVLEAQASMRNIQILCQFTPKALHVTGDANHFKQAFTNLVKNAVEASEYGGKVVIRTEYATGRGMVTIEDQGHGIDREAMRKIGTPFFTTKDTGTGLGLMVTLRIIENMGGQLNIESDAGVGTRVQITLPLA